MNNGAYILQLAFDIFVIISLLTIISRDRSSDIMQTTKLLIEQVQAVAKATNILHEVSSLLIDNVDLLRDRVHALESALDDESKNGGATGECTNAFTVEEDQ